MVLGEPYLLWEKFHEKTKFKKRYQALDFEKWPKSWLVTFFKEYPRLDSIILPNPTPLSGVFLQDIFMKRYSSRRFSNRPLSLEQLSNLLYYSAGLRENKPPWQRNRFYPSPGGRYTIEVYVIAKNSELPTGVYHYNLRSHSLETLLLLRRFRDNDYFNQDWIKKAGCIILFTVIFERSTIKYGPRGYRHVMQEAGHLGQNFYLMSTALKLAICGIGGYVDDKLNRLLDVDGVKETVAYVLAVGNAMK